MSCQEPADQFGIKDNSDVGPSTVETGTVYQNLDAFTKTLIEAFIKEKIFPERISSPNRIESEQGSNHNATSYPALQDTSDIRVLELHPGSCEDALRCTSHVCSLGFEYPPVPEDEPTWRPWLRYAVSRRTGQLIWYSALSYTWGAPSFVKPLSCNGYQVAVTENLDLALRHLRQSNTSVNLWIDQLCINQDDLKEKESQVSLMGRVYERSWNTVIWLGGEADNSSITLDVIRDFNTIFQFDVESSTLDPDSFAEHHLPIPGSRRWVDISKLLARSWFLRTWVMQEAVLSGDVAVLCGHKCVKWSDIGIFAYNLEKQDLVQYLDIEGSITNYRRIREIDRLKYVDKRSHAGFIDVLEQGRGSKATDVRDNVYGMLGMSFVTIRPEYSKSVREVYTEASATINEQRLISLFCHVDHPDSIENLPSWVVDWSQPRWTTSLGREAGPGGVYAASGDVKMLPDFTIDGYRLTTTGTIFNTISIISEVAQALALVELVDPLSRTSQFTTRCVELVLKHCQSYTASCSIFTAFWHTLVAGKDSSGREKAPTTAPDDYSPIFALLIDTATERSPSFVDQPTFKRKLTLANLKVRQPSKVYRLMQIAFKDAIECRKFGVTSNGYMGLFPQTTRVGDEICVISGGYIPFVVRRQSGSNFQLVGECYVHGIMNGEVMEMTELSSAEMTLV